MTQLVRCIGCGAAVPDESGPVHRYLESAPACWRIYGETLVREYSDAGYYAVHPYTVDAYALQHPGSPSPQTIASAAVHLVRLCLMLERGWPPDAATRRMREFSENEPPLQWMTPPLNRGDVTVLDLAAATKLEQHAATARRWAAAAWHAWSPHHAQVRAWIGAG